MSVSLGSYGTYSSALRFGLSSVKPVEEVYIEKIGKLKLIRRITKLIPTQGFSYNDYINVFYADVLQHLSQIPKFDPDEVHKHTVQRALYAVDELGLKDRIMKLEKLKESRSLSDYSEVHDILIDISRELSTMISREEESRIYVRSFFDSNFPLSYFGELMRGSQTYNKFLNLMEFELRIMKGYVMAAMQRGARHAMKVHQTRRKELRPIVDVCDDYRTSSMALKIYVELCNSDKVEDIFERKKLDANELDKKEFVRLFSNYLMKLDLLREKLSERKPGLFISKIDFAEPINNMWKKMAALTISS